MKIAKRFLRIGNTNYLNLIMRDEVWITPYIFSSYYISWSLREIIVISSPFINEYFLGCVLFSSLQFCIFFE